MGHQIDKKGSGSAFTTIQPDAGTSPVASTAADTLTFTSSDSSITITGNASTDTIDLVAAGGGGTGDHSALNNLDADDHTQYVLLAGRTGGQSLSGSDTTAQNLTLRANSADTTTGSVDITTSTESTSATTGALKVAGGVGIAKDIYVGKTINLANTVDCDTGTFRFGGDCFLHKYGTSNVFMGNLSGNFTLSGIKNTGIGSNSLNDLTTGSSNFGIGPNALQNVTTGSGNVGLGPDSLAYITTGGSNTAIGTGAAVGTVGQTATANTTYIGTSAGTVSYGSNNTGIGFECLKSNTSGSNNTAMGYRALFSNTTASSSVVIGYEAAAGSTVAEQTVYGYRAARLATTGKGTYIGFSAGYSNRTGVGNVYLGYKAGYYETAGDKLFIDNRQRTNEADGRAKALMYGIFDAATINQELNINGSMKVLGANHRIVETLTDTDTLDASNCVVLCNKGTAMTVNLPAASGVTNRYYWIRNIGAGTATIDPNSSEQIDGSSTKALATGEGCVIVCDGTAWYTIASV
jgi:hypothetical protein